MVQNCFFNYSTGILRLIVLRSLKNNVKRNYTRWYVNYCDDPHSCPNSRSNSLYSWFNDQKKLFFMLSCVCILNAVQWNCENEPLLHGIWSKRKRNGTKESLWRNNKWEKESIVRQHESLHSMQNFFVLPFSLFHMSTFFLGGMKNGKLRRISLWGFKTLFDNVLYTYSCLDANFYSHRVCFILKFEGILDSLICLKSTNKWLTRNYSIQISENQPIELFFVRHKILRCILSNFIKILFHF